MKRWLIGVCMVMVLAGPACTYEEQHTSAVLSVAQSCRAYAGALRVITPHRAAGLLSDKEIAQVNLANQVADPICMGPPPTDLADAVNKVTQATTTLLLITATVQEREVK